MTDLLAPGTRTVRAGVAPGTVIAGTATDTLVSGMVVSVVWLFERAVDPDRLAAGLATALAHLPLFAGRLHTGPDGRPRVVCDDAGVPFTVVDSTGTLAEAASRMTLPTAGYVATVPAGPGRPADAPLASVTVTRLGDGGMVVGCSWHHALGDLRSFMLLAQAWSAAVEGRPLPEVLVRPDRDAELDAVLPATGGAAESGFRLPGPDEAAELARELRAAPRANRIVQVFFGDDEVARMRADYGAEAGVRLSANDVIIGHLVGTLRRLDADGEARRLSTPVNYRRHLGLHPGAIGNLVGELTFTCPPAARPAEVAAALRREIDRYAEAHLNVRANRAFLAGVAPDRVPDVMPAGFDPRGRTFFLTNWSRAGAYDVTFGTGRPAWFGPEVPLPTPWSSWLTEGFGGSGLLATVVVPARLAGRLRTDPGLHQFRRAGDPLPALAAEVRKLA
jgi:hypothetical protein